MSQLYFFNLVSLDGYFEGPNNDLSWHNVDAEFADFAIEQLKATETILFGRKTYEMMANFWLSDEAKTDDPITAEMMNSKAKIVFSHSLAKAEWDNTRLIRDKAAEEVAKLKASSEKEIAIFGSANLATTLFKAKLIDELRILLNPVILGGGTPLFNPNYPKLKLALTKVREFKSGNVLLCYTPEYGELTTP